MRAQQQCSTSVSLLSYFHTGSIWETKRSRERLVQDRHGLAGMAGIRARESQGSGSSPKHGSPAGKQMVRKNDWRRLIITLIENQIEGIRA